MCSNGFDSTCTMIHVIHIICVQSQMKYASMKYAILKY